MRTHSRAGCVLDDGVQPPDVGDEASLEQGAPLDRPVGHRVDEQPERGQSGAEQDKHSPVDLVERSYDGPERVG